MSAKSTISSNHLLLHRVLQDQRVRNNLVSRFDAADHLLHIVREHVPADHLNAAEMRGVAWSVDPLAVMQMQDCAGQALSRDAPESRREM